MKGWICLHRSLLEHPRFRDPEWVAVWIFILLAATHRRHKVIFDGKPVELQPGQFITGRHAIARITGVRESKVRRILATLKNDQQIDQLAGLAGSILTVRNWASFQNPDQAVDQPVASEKPVSDQLSTTNNNGNNGTRIYGGGSSTTLPPRPMGTAERIDLQNRVRILKGRLKDLEGETSEQWQRDLKPGLVEEKKKLREQITELENRLLKA